MGIISIEINKEFDLVTYTIDGVVEYADVRGAVEKYYKGTPTKYTLWDFTKAEFKTNLTVDNAIELGVMVSGLGENRKDGFDLIVVSDSLKYGLARMYSAYADLKQKEYRGLKPMVFRTKDTALKWLKENEYLAKGKKE